MPIADYSIAGFETRSSLVRCRTLEISYMRDQWRGPFRVNSSRFSKRRATFEPEKSVGGLIPAVTY